MRRNVHSKLVALAAVVTLASPAVQARADEPMPGMPSGQQMEVSPEAQAPETRKQPGAVEEIVVTARKREERLQDVPISITAFSSGELEDRHITRIDEIGLATPNLNFDRIGSYSSRVYVRGVGQSRSIITEDAGVAQYLDGVYLGRSQGALFDVVDIERIEVLKGPQGTLFGKNAVGGAINTITSKPNGELGVKATLGFGSYGLFTSRVSANIPIPGYEEQLMTRVAFGSTQRDGYIRNKFNGEDLDDQRNMSGRAQVRWLPTDDVDLLLSFDQTKLRQRGPGSKCHFVDPTATFFGILFLAGVDYRGACNANLATGDYSVIEDIPGREDLDVKGYSGTLTWDLGPATLKLISAHRELEFISNNDFDATGLNVLQFLGGTSNQDQVSHELQVTGSAFDGRLSWVGGLYFLRESAADVRISQTDPTKAVPAPILAPIPIPLTFLLVTQDGRKVSHRSRAAYGELTYDVTDRLSITGGVRRTHERRHMDRFNYRLIAGTTLVEGQVSDRFNSWTPRGNVTYRINDDVMIYGGWSRGFKAGGFNGLAQGAFGDLQSFDPETLDAWEAGIKSTWFDDRLVVNLAGFYSSYDDIQISITESDPTGNTFPASYANNIKNAGEATVQGLELEVVGRPFPGLLLQGGLGLTDAQYDKFDEVDTLATSACVAAGTSPCPVTVDRTNLEFAFTPDVNFSVGAQYTLPAIELGELTLRADWYHQDDVWYDPRNRPQQHQDKYGLLSARAAFMLADGKTEISVWGRNLLDRTYNRAASYSGDLFGHATTTVAAPRMYGIEITRTFGNY